VDEASDKTLRKLIGMTTANALMVVVVVLYRPVNSVSWPAISHHTPIVLKSMEGDLTAVLIKSILGAGRVAPELSDKIHEHTGGNPFFVEELCSELLDRKAAAPGRRPVPPRPKILAGRSAIEFKAKG
jgi:predicted ATPase